MAKDFDTMEDSNRSNNPSIHEVSDPSRRVMLRGGLGALLGGSLGLGALTGCASVGGLMGGKLIGFESVPVGTADAIAVPKGYVAQAIAAWGEPVGLSGETPAFKFDGKNTAAEQAAQLGMHHDGIHFYAQEGSADATKSGLLVMNHEYVDDGLLHADGMATWTAEKVKKSQAAHGVSVIEVEFKDGKWTQVTPSPWARRITATTPMAVGGPAAGHKLMQTAADPKGMKILGTFNNCGSGKTPWGTYLTCEENFINYFNGPSTPDAHQKRWGLQKVDAKLYRWHEHDERFDAVKHPNEINRHGWVVEIDPMDASSTPVKRTALGRAAHEGATVAVTREQRAVIYMGEDSRFEYIYKFVSRDAIKPGGARANATLLDHGTLYVARFDADGKGAWLPLVHGQGPLTAANGFADQGEVLIKSRQASDLLGATKMDRPEWTAVDQKTRKVYCTLTNNSNRGVGSNPGVDAANPRANNTMGNIIEWQDSGDFDGTTFAWKHFVMAGDKSLERADAKGNIKGDAFACPDGLWVDARGTLWIQCDMSTSAMGKGDLVNLGNNMMLAADPATGEIRRFLVGPKGCEITGVTMTPDGRTMFLNVQHPGEPASERNDPANPRAVSNWPDQRADGRPRSATVVVRKADGGLIGT
ncbi:PhoX family protein [Leptothrix discophora]|uniref:PhoX family phosphatase n=1 Tax=Leptothrix discophora TaxID=89 RepID=A0ABT9G1D8_LEPDI|nr:PhoX family phosphatase [Leptothrix discophora]MDP4300301.1 PhoX family phosphatase [Leptothrix discophora]